MKKAKFALAAFAACLMLTPVTALAAETEYEEGWQNVNDGVAGNEWYQFEDGTYAQDGIWQSAEDENVYYMFDESGYLTYGWYNDGSSWYYSDPSTGELQTGWENIGGSWYYLDEASFYMYEDGYYYIEEGDEYVAYMFDENGAMTTGWYYNVDDSGLYYGNWYYSDASGKLQSGWQSIGGSWYYFSEYSYYMYEDGTYTIYADENDEEGTRYRFAKSGAMISGWYNAEPYSTYGDWSYANPDGSLREEGWFSSGGKWYWLSEYGDMYTNGYVYLLETEDGETVYQWNSTWISGYTDEEGNWVDGYTAEVLDKYYVGGDGTMVEGWYYYEYTDATGYFTNSWLYGWVGGSIKAGWVASGSAWYYVNNDGYMIRDERYDVSDEDTAPEYPVWDDFTGEDGSMSSDEYEDYNAAIDQYYKDYKTWELSNLYVFDANGVMTTGWYGTTSSWGTTWYYTNPDGTAYDGWLYDGGHWYYISYGVMLRDQYTPDGYWVDVNGVWQ